MNIKEWRRRRADLHTPAEKAIADAMQVVEGMAANEVLTDAVCLLQQAQEKVADYVDAELFERGQEESPNEK